jgi:hypothetical protein
LSVGDALRENVDEDDANGRKDSCCGTGAGLLKSDAFVAVGIGGDSETGRIAGLALEVAPMADIDEVTLELRRGVPFLDGPSLGDSSVINERSFIPLVTPLSITVPSAPSLTTLSSGSGIGAAVTTFPFISSSPLP